MATRHPQETKSVPYGSEAEDEQVNVHEDRPGVKGVPIGSEGKKTRARGKVGEPKSHDDMMKQFFEDDKKASEYLKGLISSQPLRLAWEKLSTRMTELEEASGVKKSRANMNEEELARAFATRQECRQIVNEEYEGRLGKYERRLDALEASLVIDHRRFETDEQDLATLHAELATHWKTIEDAQQDILRVEMQDKNHNEGALKLHQQLTGEIARQEASFADALLGVNDRHEGEKCARQSLDAGLQVLKDFLYSAGLQQQLEKICCDMLMKYVSWEDMEIQREQIHTGAVSAATEPLEMAIKQTGSLVEANHTKLNDRNAALYTDLLALGGRIDSNDRKHVDRIDDVVSQVNLRAMDTRVSDVEKRLIARDEFMEIDFTEFKEINTKKVEEAYERLQELESSIFTHEHALEHWAEEIGNRATKYDMMVLSSRVEKCALRDKSEADYKEVQKTLKWQSVKIENLTFKSNFGSSDGERQRQSVRRSRSMHRSQSKAVEEPADNLTESGGGTPRAKLSVVITDPEMGEDPGETTITTSDTVHHPTPPVMPRHQADSELTAIVMQQLESLGHCVLGLGHATLRTAVCGQSREEKRRHEDRLLYHISNLLHWIMHRSAPHDWDPMELTSLGIKWMESSQEDKRRSLSPQSQPRRSRTPEIREGSSPRSLLTRAETWAADHLPTALSAHSEHLPVAVQETPRHRRSQTQKVDESASPVLHEPMNIPNRAAQRAGPSRERAERREQRWVEKGGSPTTGWENLSLQGSLTGGSVSSSASTQRKREAGGAVANPKRASKAPMPQKRSFTDPTAGAESNPQRMRDLVVDMFGEEGRPHTGSGAKPSSHLLRNSPATSRAPSKGATEVPGDNALPALGLAGTMSARSSRG
jgi:hypothetical protein